MQEIVTTITSYVWSSALVYLCLGAGLFFSIMTRFVQVRQFREMIRLLTRGRSSTEGISTFQALAVSLSGRVGTGNIAGVAAAIGFGGPALYIEKVLGQKWYAWIFALATLMATGFLLPGVQANAIGNAVDLALGGGALIESPFGEVSQVKLIAGSVIVVFLGTILLIQLNFSISELAEDTSSYVSFEF